MVDQLHDNRTNDLAPLSGQSNTNYTRVWFGIVGVAALAIAVGLALVLPTSSSEVSQVSAQDSELRQSSPDLAWDPARPLFDGKPREVSPTQVLTTSEIAMTAEASSSAFSVTTTHQKGVGSVAFGANPGDMPAIVYGYASDSASPPAFAFYDGVTRPEVARIDLVFADGSIESVETVMHESFPDLRFFTFEASGDGSQASANLVAYSASGEKLTDSASIIAAQARAIGE